MSRKWPEGISTLLTPALPTPLHQLERLLKWTCVEAVKAFTLTESGVQMPVARHILIRLDAGTSK